MLGSAARLLHHIVFYQYIRGLASSQGINPDIDNHAGIRQWSCVERKWGERNMPSDRPSAHIVRTHAGDIKILITSAETDGVMSMIDTTTHPGGGPTYHSHSREDEAFYVISGTAEIQIENKVYLCRAGDSAFGPRNVFHTYRNVGDTELKMLIVYTPAGFEQSFIDTAAMLEEGKNQGAIGQMLLERYGLTRGQLPDQGK
jgi:quercetin dioxygenase-like cupin family protein